MGVVERRKKHRRKVAVEGTTCNRAIRAGLCLFDQQSAVPTFFRRYCLLKLRLMNNYKELPSHLLVFVHASRQPVKIAWSTAVESHSDPAVPRPSQDDDQDWRPNLVVGCVFLRRPEICIPGSQVEDAVRRRLRLFMLVCGN